jgi:hypothetical protein
MQAQIQTLFHTAQPILAVPGIPHAMQQLPCHASMLSFSAHKIKLQINVAPYASVSDTRSMETTNETVEYRGCRITRESEGAWGLMVWNRRDMRVTAASTLRGAKNIIDKMYPKTETES